MRFGAGMVAGFVLGALVATAAHSGAVSLRWFTPGKALTISPEEQAGYVAGVYDATEYARLWVEVDAAAHPGDVSWQTERNFFTGWVACMNAHPAGRTLEDFREWAVGVWTSTTHDDWSAAEVMLLEGCSPPWLSPAPPRTP